MPVRWITAGRFVDRILSVKFLTSMTSHWITQRTALEFLKSENLDRHMRTIRQAFEQRVAIGIGEIDKWPHIIRRHSRPKGGAVVWMELPDNVDTMRLFELAAAKGISFMPGALFSVGKLHHNEFAMNFSFPWTDEAMATLRRLATTIESLNVC